MSIKLPSSMSYLDVQKLIEVDSPVYGETQIKLKYVVAKLIWKSSGKKVMFIAVEHPKRGKILLLCTDLDMDPVEVIKLYALRFKIELSFNNSIHVVGSYDYRFWLKSMSPTKRGALDVNFFELDSDVQNKIQAKLNAYHLHIQVGLIAQGLLQYLSCAFPQQIWQSFGSAIPGLRASPLASLADDLIQSNYWIVVTNNRS